MDPCEYGPVEDVAGHHLAEGGGRYEFLHAHGGRENGGRGGKSGKKEYHIDNGSSR